MEIPNEVTVPIDVGIEVDGKEIDSVTLRRPVLEDELAARTAAPTPLDAEPYLMAALAGLPPETMHDMALGDYQRVLSTYAERFFHADPPPPRGDQVPLSASLALDVPLEVDGELRAALSIRRPRLRDDLDAQRAASSRIDTECVLMANLTEVPPDAMRRIFLGDFTRLQRLYLASFFRPAGRTGAS